MNTTWIHYIMLILEQKKIHIQKPGISCNTGLLHDRIIYPNQAIFLYLIYAGSSFLSRLFWRKLVMTFMSAVIGISFSLLCLLLNWRLLVYALIICFFSGRIGLFFFISFF